MALWPSTLPTSVLVSGHTEADEVNVVRFKVDVGPEMARRRGTARVTVLNGQLLLTLVQLDTLLAFFRTTCADGSLPFDWTNPLTGNVCSYRWKKPPQASALAPREAGRDVAKVTVNIELERLPNTEIVGGGGTPVDPVLPEPQLFFAAALDTLGIGSAGVAVREPAFFDPGFPDVVRAAELNELVLIVTEDGRSSSDGFLFDSTKQATPVPIDDSATAAGGGEFDLFGTGIIRLIVIQ